MKKLLLYLTLSLTAHQFVAQTSFNRSYHDKLEYGGPFVTAINSDYCQLSDGEHGAVLYRYSSTGVLERRKEIGYIPNLGLKTNDDNLLLVASYNMCDVWIPPYTDIIQKLDTAGNVLFATTYTYSSQGSKFSSVIQNPDSSYILFTDSLMIKYSKTGQFVSQTSLGLQGISSALLMPNNSILLSTTQGLSLIMQTGIIVNTTSAPQLKKLAFYNGQKILGCGNDGKLYKFSANCGAIGSSAFTGMFVKDFICESDTIYAISADKYLRCDTLLNMIASSGNSNGSINQTAICKNGHFIGISSGVNSHGYNYLTYSYNKYANLSVFDRLAGSDFGQDLELSAFEINGLYYANSSANIIAKVRIKNKGNMLVTNFRLNCFLYQNIDCGMHYYQEEFNNQSLLPGDSLVVMTSTISKANLFGNPPLFYYYCIFVTTPNDEGDKNSENNMLCDTASFVGIKEVYLSEQFFKIYPNPFESSIGIESDIMIKNIEVLNSLGILVSKNTVNKKQVSFSNSELGAGIYFLKIETEKGTALKKIIKQ